MLGPAARFWISTVQRYRLRRHLLISFLTDLLIFYRVHGRLPKRDSYLINDIWFWMKADRDGIALTPFTDKETAKSFIAGIAGADMVPETYAILRGEAELRAFRCDRPYVAKPTHTSGGAVIKPHGGPLTEAEEAGGDGGAAPLFVRIRMIREGDTVGAENAHGRRHRKLFLGHGSASVRQHVAQLPAPHGRQR